MADTRVTRTSLSRPLLRQPLSSEIIDVDALTEDEVVITRVVIRSKAPHQDQSAPVAGPSNYTGMMPTADSDDEVDTTQQMTPGALVASDSHALARSQYGPGLRQDIRRTIPPALPTRSRRRIVPGIDIGDEDGTVQQQTPGALVAIDFHALGIHTAV